MSIDHSTGCPISKKYTVNQGCMSLSTYLLEYGRHVARLRRRRRAYAPTSNTASHDNHKKILHEFPFLSRDDYGAPLGGPSGRRSSAMNFFCHESCFVMIYSLKRGETTPPWGRGRVGCGYFPKISKIPRSIPQVILVMLIKFSATNITVQRGSLF